MDDLETESDTPDIGDPRSPRAPIPEIALITACGALALIPIQLRNPDFVRSFADGSTWIGVCVVVPLLLASTGAVASGRMLRDGTKRRTVTRAWWRGCSLLSATGLLLVSVWAARGEDGRGKSPERQLIVIGIDGADWRIVNELRAQGRLPALDALVREGARATLSTFRPSLSPVIWTSIASGVMPGQHGIADFFTSSEEVKVKRVWEIADEHGLVSGSLGYLVTWPPQKSGGFLVPGWLAQDESTVPPELSFVAEFERSGSESEAAWLAALGGVTRRALAHGLTLETLRSMTGILVARALRRGDEREREVARRILSVMFQADVFCHLLRTRRPDLALVYHNQVDVVGHLFFKFYQPEGFPDVTPEQVEALGDALPRLYQASDAAVARIRRCAEEDATLMVVSDHGQRARKSESEDLLAVKTRRLLSLLGIDEALWATNFVGRVFLRAASSVEAYENAIDSLRRVTTVPDARSVFAFEPAEAGHIMSLAIPWQAEKRVRLGDRELKLEEFVEVSRRYSGIHTPRALFLIAGPEIARGELLPRGHIVDVAPTILGLLRLPVARDLDGRFMAETIRPELRNRFALRTVDSYGPRPAAESQRAKTRELEPRTIDLLERLGYVE